MAMTFDATLKDMGSQSPQGFLAVFDRPPNSPVTLLNVDLSTVTAAADLILGLGKPLEEIIQLDFQSSASAWKHADLMVYNALLYARYHVPVHTIMVLLRPQAEHSRVDGVVHYAPRLGRGSMDFRFELLRLWQRPVEDLLAADIGVTPLAMLGQLPMAVSPEMALAAVAERVVERLTHEASPGQAKKLLTDALLLTGLRVKRDVVRKIFRGVQMLQDSDTYWMIIEEGEERATRENILAVGEERLGACAESVRAQLSGITDLGRLKRIVRRAAKAESWQEILDTP